MKRIHKYIAFLSVGVASLILMNVILAQDKTYFMVNNSIVQLQQKFGNINEQDQQLKKRIQENIIFIEKLPSTTKTYSQILDSVPVQIRQTPTVLDKASQHFLQGLKSIIDSKEIINAIDDSIQITKGKQNGFVYNLSSRSNEYLPIKGKIILGTEDIKNNINSSFNRVFGNNVNLKLDFYVFHEYGHALSYYIDGNENTDLRIGHEIIKQFVSQQKHPLEEDDIKIIKTSYVEGVGDLMAVQLLLKKHPQLLNDLDFIDKIANERFENSKLGDIYHLTTAGLLQFKENIEKNGFQQQQSVEEMLTVARKFSLQNIEFYSSLTFSSNAQYKERENHVILNDNINNTKDESLNDEEVAQLKNKIQKIRNTFNGNNKYAKNQPIMIKIIKEKKV